MSRIRGTYPERSFDKRDIKRPLVEINCATTEEALSSAIPIIRDDKVEEGLESLQETTIQMMQNTKVSSAKSQFRES